MSELLSCPFCGSSRIRTTFVRDGRMVGCGDCGAASGPAFHGPENMPSADNRAQQNWNNRAGSPAPVGEGERTIIAADDPTQHGLETLMSEREAQQAVVEAAKEWKVTGKLGPLEFALIDLAKLREEGE